MSTDVIIVDSDKIQITINSPCVVPTLLVPASLVATGQTTVSDKKVCIEGDELPPSLKLPMPYTSPPYVTPGMGTVSVTLKAANKSSVSTDDGKKMLLQGSTFDAKFEVSQPAMMPTPAGPQPDPNAAAGYKGTAQFISTNTVAVAE